jgi:Domain of unknown function (DUF4440)
VSRIHAIKDDALTLALAERIERIWQAHLALDSETHHALLADGYRAVQPNGTVHLGKPTAEEIAAVPIEDYWLRELQAWPVGEEGAIATYTAEVEVRRGLTAERHRFEVGEVWMKQSGEWKCRYYHATPLK